MLTGNEVDEENLMKAAELAKWLIEKRKIKRSVADLVASRKFKVDRKFVSPARQLLKPKQQTLL